MPGQMFQSNLFPVILIRMFQRFTLFMILEYNTTLTKPGKDFQPGAELRPGLKKSSCNPKEISARAEKQEIVLLPDSPETLRA